MRRARLLLAVVILGGCAASPEPGDGARYVPDRRDYAAFRASQPDLLEPNYLPFMVHRIPQEGAEGDLLIFCRWDDDDMPLPVYVEAPVASVWRSIAPSAASWRMWLPRSCRPA